MLPKLEGITGTIDLKVIKEKNSTDILDLLPVCQLKIRLSNDDKFIFEVSGKGLNEVIKVFDDLKKQLEAAKLCSESLNN